MMDQQMDSESVMSEQPQDPQDQLDRQNSISAGQLGDTSSGVQEAPQDTSPINRPVDTPDRPAAAVSQPGQQDQEQDDKQDQEAARAQRPQPNQPNVVDMTDMSAPPERERPSPNGSSVEAGTAGSGLPGPDRAPARTAERQGPDEPGGGQPLPLLSTDVAGVFLERWDRLQATFVDEPRQVVEQADSLVAEVMQRIAESMAQERTGLERQWEAGDAVSTEDLRVALQHYRSFFKRLLSA